MVRKIIALVIVGCVLFLYIMAISEYLFKDEHVTKREFGTVFSKTIVEYRYKNKPHTYFELNMNFKNNGFKAITVDTELFNRIERGDKLYFNLTDEKREPNRVIWLLGAGLFWGTIVIGLFIIIKTLFKIN